jgi:nucleoside diphosphate kinase
MEHRPIDNLIHASGNPEEAAYEINIWFPEMN